MPSDALIINPLEVKVVGNLEKTLKTFRAIVQKEKILSEYKEAQRFEKPSDKKRREKNEAALARLEEQGVFKNPKSPSKKSKSKFKDKDSVPEPVSELVLAEMHLARKIEQRKAEALAAKKQG